MDIKEIIEQVRFFISKAEIAKAIELLHILLKHTPKFYEILLQSSRYSNLLKQIRQGQLMPDEANITRNKISLALLQIVDEIDEQKYNPSIRQEIEQLQSNIKAKNLIIDSCIQSTGDIQIGNEITYTESNLSKRLRIFLFVIVPLLVIGGTFFWYQYQAGKKPLMVKIQIENISPNEELEEPLGTLTLIYGGTPNPRNEMSTGTVIFDQIPSNLINQSFRLQYEAKDFIPIDTTFKYVEFIKIPIRRNNKYALLQGYIYEEGTEPLIGIEGVKIMSYWDSVFTDATGKFSLPIPDVHQRKKQRLDLFKDGFYLKSITEPINKDILIRQYLIRQ